MSKTSTPFRPASLLWGAMLFGLYLLTATLLANLISLILAALTFVPVLRILVLSLASSPSPEVAYSFSALAALLAQEAVWLAASKLIKDGPLLRQSLVCASVALMASGILLLIFGPAIFGSITTPGIVCTIIMGFCLLIRSRCVRR